MAGTARWLRGAHRDDARVDPIDLGARYGLAAAQAERLWQRICADGGADLVAARARFVAEAQRLAAGDAVGRRSLVEAELAGRAAERRWLPVPGRETRVGLERRFAAPVLRHAEHDEIASDAAEQLARVRRGGGEPLPAAMRARLEAALASSAPTASCSSTGTCASAAATA
ncbi:MAG TPA: hypothetical protein VFP84_23885 [Kofleriaceae bacterium]|nr:hypothetical protein [Kofleriaceae bacterium]